MLRLLGTTMCMVCSFVGFSQNLKGKVTDNTAKLSIPYATVILKDSLGKFMQGVSTDDKGLYNFTAKKGSFTLEITFIGYEKAIIPVQIKEQTELNIALEPTTKALDEVTVVGEKTEIVQLIDKKVINVGKDLLSAGGDASTVLGQLAEIKIDPSGNLSLRGSQNVNVLLNGKPSPLSVNELLKQIPANQISKIEVITVPSAKYQANGLTGIINIITKTKGKQGFNANFNADANSLNGWGFGTDVSYGTEKFRYKLGVSHNRRFFENTFAQQRNGFNTFEQNGGFFFSGKVTNFNIGIDWFVDKKNELSIGTDYTNNSHNMDNLLQIFRNNAKNSQNNAGFHGHKTQNYSLNYRHIFKEGEHFLDVDARLSKNGNDLTSNFESNTEINDSDIENKVSIYDVAIDYTAPISKKVKLESGYAFNQSSNRNSFNAYGSTSKTFDDFLNIETVHALYCLTKWNIGKVAIQTGLRGEFFERNADLITLNKQVKFNFNNLFPSIHANYSLKDNQSLAIGYNKRTSRPSFFQVIPTNTQQYQYDLHVGNPNLEPEFSNNIELTYQLDKPKYTVSSTLSYRYKENIINGYTFKSTNGIAVNSFKNFGVSNGGGLDFSLSLKTVKWMKNSLSMSYNYEKFGSNLETFMNGNGNSTSIRFNNDFTVSPKFSASLNYMYSGVEQTIFERYIAYQKVDAGMRYKLNLFKNKGNIGLRITDIFNTLKYEFQAVGDGFSTQNQFKPLSRVVYLTFSYGFEKGNANKKRNKNTKEYKSGIVN
jgi:outer membrane receptor protein involved in Fe transport